MQPKLNEYNHSFLLAETFLEPTPMPVPNIVLSPGYRLLFGMRLFNLSTLRVNDDGLYSGSYF